MKSRKALRELLTRTRYTIVPGAYDPFTARLVQLAGFDAVYLSGGAFSRAQGYPDLGLLTMTEIVQHFARAVDCIEIPAIADMDTGYGNALNVVRSVREYERVGIAGFHLEDQVTPKKCGHYDGKQIVAVEEMVGKIKAAVDTRQDRDMVVIARTDAIAVEGFDAAIERMHRYLEAGADVAFVEAPCTEGQMRAIPGLFTKPAMANIFEGGKTPSFSAKILDEMGFRFGIYAGLTHRAAVFAAREALQVLRREGGTASYEARLIPFVEREQALDTEKWSMLERYYS